MTYENRTALIDCGTNTFNLLIVDINSPTDFTTIYSEKLPVKIGEGGIQFNSITNKAINRAIIALKSFKKTIDNYHVIHSNIKATATSAFRNATNAALVVDSILRETGLQIIIIDGTTEATLIYKGVSTAVTLTDDNSLIIDIGGGSVECIICNKNGIQWLKSYEIGGQRLKAKYHIIDPISKNNIDDLENFLHQELEDLTSMCKKLNPTEIIGASGAFETLTEIYSNEQIINSHSNEILSNKLPLKPVLKIINNLITKNNNQRLAIKGMVPLRSEMIVVAGILLKVILKETQIQKIKTTNYALKEGLVFTTFPLA